MTDFAVELYGTSGCHLCEDANAMLEALCIEAHYRDIANNDALMEQYALRIPVLRRSDAAELNWPFSASDVLRFLAGV